ncbi:sensor histidine kinase NtrY-like [Candidatus Raskinella chloraquaticus]|uniref:histidine kinase n=1 Tax=Candidatus Raskinella chloraquaticus TaxID=1951219 RepID=A0A1W9HZV8_9HYPH|nr:MAG: PAS domain-containing sensor histidine kinase [Proteobacteria bacterium SG_bin8]
MNQISVSPIALTSSSPSTSRMSGWLGAITVTLALLSALATFLIVTGHTPIIPSHEVVVAVLAINAILCLLLFTLIIREIWPLWIAHRRGQAAVRLHGRIVAMFSLVAAVPAVVVAIVSALTLSGGLDRWFSERTKAIIENATLVGRAYLNENAGKLAGDTLAMATDVATQSSLLVTEPQRFNLFFSNQANLRGLPVAYLIRKNRSVVQKAETGFSTELPLPPEQVLEQATQSEPLILTPGGGPTGGMIGAVVPVANNPDLFLYVARSIDKRILGYLAEAESASADYEIAQIRRAGVQLAFALMYSGVALILLLSAIWFGVSFANRLVEPIRRLIGAADQVGRGNYYVQVPVKPSEGDLAHLGQTFNGMTSALRQQRDEVMSANEQLDQRRRFTEAVLAGISAGVIGLDHDLVVTIATRSAYQLLDLEEGSLVGRLLGDVVPELAVILTDASEGNRRAMREVGLERRGRPRVFLVRVTSEESPAHEHGYVVTLDDISDLVLAQRSAAWADVARRIAHEIKNPLTPIQLSAERLKRRYGSRITEDREVFDQCVDTIIRQVGDIGRMVDEFSSFARMPTAQISRDDLTDTIKQVIFLMRVGNPNVDIVADLPPDRIEADFDRRLLGQALTNVIKNAVEAVTAIPTQVESGGKVTVRLEKRADELIIEVTDNGIGLPKDQRERLLEPYMTTREKGTGLGLAIVAKIVEELAGRIELHDAPDVASGGHGALIRLVFPQFAAAANPAPASAQ